MVRSIEPSEPPTTACRQVPPYLPTFSSGVTTSGCSGSRCATGGNLPAVTSAARTGASRYSAAQAAPPNNSIGIKAAPHSARVPAPILESSLWVGLRPYVQLNIVNVNVRQYHLRSKEILRIPLTECPTSPET